MTTILAHAPAPPRPPVSETRRVVGLVVEVLAAVAVLAVVVGLVLNYVWVHLQFFGVAPDINPVTLGIHRGLLGGGVLALVAMGVAGWTRRGWRWTATLTGLFLATAGTFVVEGAVPFLR